MFRNSRRGSGLMGARWYRTVVGAAVLATASLFFAGSALAVTITSFTPTTDFVPEEANACVGTMITINGTGFVNDVYLNRDTLTVEAFELETPWHEHRFRGPRLIMPSQVHSCGQDLMIVVPRGSRVARPVAAPEMRNLQVGWEERTLRVPANPQAGMTEVEAPVRRTA